MVETKTSGKFDKEVTFKALRSRPSTNLWNLPAVFKQTFGT